MSRITDIVRCTYMRSAQGCYGASARFSSDSSGAHSLIVSAHLPCRCSAAQVVHTARSTRCRIDSSFLALTGMIILLCPRRHSVGQLPDVELQVVQILCQNGSFMLQEQAGRSRYPNISKGWRGLQQCDIRFAVQQREKVPNLPLCRN